MKIKVLGVLQASLEIKHHAEAGVTLLHVFYVWDVGVFVQINCNNWTGYRSICTEVHLYVQNPKI